MRNRRIRAWAFAIAFVAIAALFAQSAFAADVATIRIAAAANLAGTLEGIAKGYEDATPGVKVEITFASSGALSTQIRNGAPYDLFLSADVATAKKLFDDGFATEAPRVYATGVLCVASKLGVDPSGGLAFLLDVKYKTVAIAQPELAPYGLAAKQALTAKGLWDKVQAKLVFGQNIGQVNQYVTTGASDSGFVNLSAIVTDKAYAYGDRKGIAWAKVPPALYSPIEQAGVAVKRDASLAPKAKAFLDYLIKGEGKKALEKSGYGVS
jgi:molybdate transport system substrate-binding protein